MVDGYLEAYERIIESVSGERLTTPSLRSKSQTATRELYTR
jgi:hypothetical protein